MTIYQKITCDHCNKDIDTMQHTVLVYNTGKTTVRQHFHHPCFFELDPKGNPIFTQIRQDVYK